MKLSAVHSESRLGDWDFNLKETFSWLEKMENYTMDFVLFPEMNLSGYSNNPSIIRELSTEWPNQLQKLLKKSKCIDCTFAVGAPEEENGRFYISQFLIHKGKLIGKHRKTHLGPTETNTFSNGADVAIFEQDKVIIGMQLCYESHFPELSSVQAHQGAHLIAFAFASPRETPEQKLNRLSMYLPARAYDNGCFAIACTMSGSSIKGKQMAGVALIVGPKGELLATSSGYEGGFCSAEINLQELERIRHSKMGWFNQHKNIELINRLYTEINTASAKAMNG